MALVSPSSPCAVCGVAIGNAKVFGTSGVFLPRDHPLSEFCDAPIHWDCYAKWPHRSEFARAYVSARVGGDRHNPHWAVVLESERVAVSFGISWQHVCVWLWDVGTRVDVPLAQWQQWCSTLPVSAAREHQLVQEALKHAKVDLQRELPTAESVTRRVDWDALNALREAEAEEAQSREDARLHDLSVHQEKWKAVVAGRPTCPHCGAGDKIRPKDLFPKSKSYFVCGSCGRSFDGVDS